VLQREERARNGDVETAIAKFCQAQKWNLQLNFDLNQKAQNLKKQGQ
jgi:hypothetical protein